MQKPRVLITDDVHPVMVQEFQHKGYEVHFRPNIIYEEVKKIIPDYDGIIINSKINCDRDFLDLTARLKFIGRLGSGREVVDTDYAKTKGIAVYFSPEGNKNAVAEHALAMLLALANQLVISDREVRSRIWRREARRGWELSGKTIGLIGFGHTGSQFAKKLSGLEMTILVHDKYKTGFQQEYPFVSEVSKNTLLNQSDILSLHLPLAPDTFHYADELFFASCKPGAVIINTSRGTVIHTEALLESIQRNHLGGACLDVFENEKPEQFNTTESEMYQKLYDLPQVVLSPHIAGWTHESKLNMATVLIDKIFHHPVLIS